MATDQGGHPGEAPKSRPTRCQLFLALLLLVGVSAIGWYLVWRLV